MPRKWSLRAGKRRYQREVFDYFLWLAELARQKEESPGASERAERWQVFLGGMESALCLSKREIRAFRGLAKQKVKKKLKKFWQG